MPGNLLESEDSLRFIIEALGSLVESNGFLINLPMGANVDATPLHRVMSYQARSVVILTFDTTETRDRVWKAARAVKPSTNFSGRMEYYFTEIAKRTKMRRQNRTEDEHQGMGNDTENTQEEKRTMKLKKRSKEKSQAVILATKLKNEYSAFDECAENKTAEVGQNFLESTRLDDENAVEACLSEETRLVEEVERIRDRENSDCDLRETMRKRAGPSDLRHTNLNRDTDARELLQQKAGPSDLRYSKLQPEKRPEGYYEIKT